MLGILFKLFGVAVGTVLVLYIGANAFRNARRLDQRIQEFKEEQEELEKQGRAINPYAALAELYAQDQQPDTSAHHPWSGLRRVFSLKAWKRR